MGRAGDQKKIKRKHPVLRVIGLLLAALIVVSTAVFFVFVSDVYQADTAAESALTSDSSGATPVRIVEAPDVVAFLPENPQAALAYYPGGRVEYTAYAPLMRALAERGIACVLVEVPLNLAFFDIGAADGAKDLLASEGVSDTLPFYVGGHSLGGSTAAFYLADHVDECAGIVMTAAYSTVDLSALNVESINVYGENDLVVGADTFAKYAPNLSSDAAELVIEGGNHAQFGSYGPQNGDGVAAISADEQVAQAADFIAAHIVAAGEWDA